ncbi:MAG TPA: twin-arginine translocation signal domain-containing protein [Vicinamibacterales bacterium]|nr:twin-arginine translocation signal domain-containing protein [Vicinamibacterales bacterium]
MSDDLSRLCNDFDRGRLSRRQLLKALGIAAAAFSPATALAQGQCGGKLARTPGCNQTPARLPFEPTGWRTVLLDHLSCQVADYPKEAAYYNALMNWNIRSDNGKEAVLDVGDWGGLVLRGGYHAPAASIAAEKAAFERYQGRLPQAARHPFVPRNALVDSFCWGIEPWDARTVEAELRKRGLNPVADNHGPDFESFHVKDPDGFDLQISNGNRSNRRRTPAHGRTSAPAPFAHTDWKTTWLDHISFQVADYKKTVAFYSALLGWKPGPDEGSQNQCEIGEIGDIIIRRGYRVDAAGKAISPIPRIAEIDHISFGITPFDPDEVEAALLKRGLTAFADTGTFGKVDIHKAFYKSYHTTTPNGFNLQVSNVTRATRSGQPTPA